MERDMENNQLSRNVYLYQRFSSSKQEGNSSLFRQGEAQQLWLSLNPKCQVVELDGSPLIDEGVSAYSGKHLESGSLGRLVTAIESKSIEKGSIILVEHFSRLSRMSITETGRLLDKIWDHGITIVTARDNNIYSPENRDDMATRMRLIVEIDKAHSDSEWRSEKVKTSWVRREVDAKEKGIVPRMRMPFWLDKEGKLNDFHPIVKDIFELHAQGLGQVLIERELRKRYGKVKPLKNINPTKIMRIIKSDKCIGIVYGKKLYDAVIEEDIFYSAQRICEERLFTSVREDRKWPLHGLVKCGLCGSGMSIQQTKNSLPLLRCSRKQRSGGENCKSPTTFPYVVAYHFFHIYIEPVILSLLSDNKRSLKFDSERLGVKHRIKSLHNMFAEAKNTYLDRTNSGKKANSTLMILDDIQEEIDQLLDKEEKLQGKIEAQKSMMSISTSIIELSNSNVKKYNLELNKAGFKIKLKDKTLSFSIDDEQGKIASLTYIKYDRKKRAYIYKFNGYHPRYKKQSYSGEIRTDDWTVDRLLNPNQYESPDGNNFFATVMHELMIHDESGAPFSVDNKN
jgi:hypothetical protein